MLGRLGLVRLLIAIPFLPALERNVGVDVESAELLLGSGPHLEQGISLLLILIRDNYRRHRGADALTQSLKAAEKSVEAIPGLISDEGESHVGNGVDIGHGCNYHQWKVENVGAVRVIAAQAATEAFPGRLCFWEGKHKPVEYLLGLWVLPDSLIIDAFIVERLDDRPGR